MRRVSTGLSLSDALDALHNTIITQVKEHSNSRDFDNLLTALISDLNDLSQTRMATDYPPILRRMFERLNTHNDGTPIELPFDSRWSSVESQIMSPIAISISELAVLIEIMRNQVMVHSANGVNLDSLGIDYSFPRFEATHAMRIGWTENGQGNRADFPINSLFVAENTDQRIEFEIYETINGDVIFRCVEPGEIGNLYEGVLLPGQPINNISRAAITGTLQPGQARETDEEYRRRFLRHLRRVAFGGNAAQYLEQLQSIDGVFDAFVFPVWRGEATIRASIVGSGVVPVSDEFVEYVNNKIDPIVRSGSGFGIAPIGHRVTVGTPKWQDININIHVTLPFGVTLGQVQTQFNAIIEEYFAEIRQNILEEWERTYFSNDGISNAFVNIANKFNALAVEHKDPRISELAIYFPADKAIQTHTWYTRISRAIIGARILESRLAVDVDIENILLNGQAHNIIIEQTQEDQFLPRVGDVNYIQVGEYGDS